MKAYIPTFVAVGVLLVAGFVHSRTVDLDSSKELLQQASHRLGQVPGTLGDWSSENFEISERTLGQAEAAGYLSRRYVHRPTGSTVNVMILCGRPGPISVHPPTICFTGTGLRLFEDPKRYQKSDAAGEPMAEFWLGDFSKPNAAVPENIRTFWTWSSDGNWEAPDHPRMKYAPSAILYKMYITRPMLRMGESLEEDVSVGFMDLFLPALNKTLFQSPTSDKQG